MGHTGGGGARHGKEPSKNRSNGAASQEEPCYQDHRSAGHRRAVDVFLVERTIDQHARPDQGGRWRQGSTGGGSFEERRPAEGD